MKHWLIKHFPPSTPNIGDCILNAGTRKIINTIFENNCDILSLTSECHALINPELLQTPITPQNTIMKGITPATLGIGYSPDVVVLGAGPMWRFSALMKIAPLTIPNLLKRPILVIGVGKFDYSIKSYPELDQISPAIAIASARDEKTAQDMRETLPCPVYMTGCPALYFRGNRITNKPNSSYFVIVYRQAKVPNDFQISLSFIKKMEQLFQAQAIITFHDFRDYHWSALTQTFEDYPCVCMNDLDSAVDLYSQAKFVITYRLHGEILSATSGAPFFHFYIDDRGKYFSETFDPDHRYHYDLNKGPLTETELIDKLKLALESDYEDYNKKIDIARTNRDHFIEHTQKILNVHS